MKDVIVICQSAPFDCTAIREGLDMALIFAAIEQNISILFQGPAVNALLSEQNPTHAGLKNYFKTLGTLDLYDVENVYVCESSLSDYEIAHEQLSIACHIVDSTQIQQLLKHQGMVITL